MWWRSPSPTWSTRTGWDLVREDVTGLLPPGRSSRVRLIVPVSATTGSGLDALRTALAAAVSSVPSREAADVFRLPVDRSFTIKGTGTVVTGTVWTGHLGIDDVVRILPGSRTARVRGLQSHGEAVARIGAGMRAAVNAYADALSEATRAAGCTLVTDAAWDASTRLRADVMLLADARPIGPRTRIRFHLGTQDVSGRVVATAGALGAGAITAPPGQCSTNRLSRAAVTDSSFDRGRPRRPLVVAWSQTRFLAIAASSRGRARRRCRWSGWC